jgi:hypothetical protein
MTDRLELDEFLSKFERERSIRRTVTLLEAKRKRFREELQQLVSHLTWLIPLKSVPSSARTFHTDLLAEAVEQLGDEAFTQLLLQVLQEKR